MSDKDKVDEIEYPISKKEQENLWDECWHDAQEKGYEYAYTLAMTQSLFAYRVNILSQRSEITNEELSELLEDGS